MLKYLKKKKSFEDEIKSIFHHFQKAFSQVNIEESQYLNKEDYGVIEIHLWKEIYFAQEVLTM